MKVIVQQESSKPCERYPWTHRVEFVCHLYEADQVLEWISQNELKGPAWHLNTGVVLYTTKQVATFCALRWA